MRETYQLGEYEILTGASKRSLVKEYGEKYGLRHLVETGSYFYETALELHSYFDLIDTVEVHEGLYRAGCTLTKDLKNVICHFGDSAEFVERLAPSLDKPTLWYLDAHASGPESGGDKANDPLRRELTAIFSCIVPGSVVLVDDARFLGQGSWPTLEDIKALAVGWTIEVADDVVRITQ